MWQRIGETLANALTSKKFLMTVGGILTVLGNQGVTEQSINLVAAMVSAYVFGQGIADVNKTKV